MNDNFKKIQDCFKENTYQPEEDLNEIRWFVKQGEYEKAAMLVDFFEKRYGGLLQKDDIQCGFWTVKLEILTQGFECMELSRNEEKVVVRLYKKIMRMNRLSVPGMRYLVQRESYLRIEKKLDFLEARKKLFYTIGTAIIWIPTMMLILKWFAMNNNVFSEFVINAILAISSIIWLCMMIFELMIYKKAYSRWQVFLMNPVPFEYSKLL